MKNKLQKWLTFACLLFLISPSFSQNICLDFDGIDDFVDSQIPLGNTDFTTEMWFRSLSTDVNPNCNGNFERLFSFSGTNTRFEIGLCGGELNIYWFDTGNSSQGPTSCQAGISYNDNNWHHIAVTRSVQQVTIFIDCIPIVCPLTINNGFNITALRLGRWPGGGVTPGELWFGQVDDVRIWDFAKTQTQIDDEKECVLSGSETGFQLYWNFDEGIAGGTNTGPVIDSSPNGFTGTLNGFALNGNSSNYVISQASLVYPNLNNTSIEIKDYPYQNALLTEICPGEPAHFSMLHNGVAPGPFNNVTVDWYYSDSPSNPPVLLPTPPFTDFRFGVPSGNINYDCSLSTDGFVDRTFHAISTVQSNSTGTICEYKSDEYDLRICCDFGSATVDITPPGPMCENEILTVNVCLNSSDLFVQTPGPYVDIVWMINGGSATSLNNQLCFSHFIFPPYPSLPHDYCFKATVTNCNGKSAVFENCVRVDANPICGTIDALPLGSPQNLMQVATSPHPIYEICPRNDAILGIDIPFQNCNPQWQYSYTNTLGSWVDLGFSNSVQNTNIIPTSAWPANVIYYRIQCNPLANPSGCDPCYSNIVEIRLKDQPITNAIGGISQLCKGLTNTLTVASPNAAHTYTWFCDGLQVGTGTSFTYIADQSACYWFETSDGCYVVESPHYCVTVCEVIPLMTCPLPPNECACLGAPITLDACASYSTCSNPAPNLQYTWYINNVQQPPSGCTITHTPPASGATYRVDIVNLSTGCVASTEKTIVPCDKN